MLAGKKNHFFNLITSQPNSIVNHENYTFSLSMVIRMTWYIKYTLVQILYYTLVCISTQCVHCTHYYKLLKCTRNHFYWSLYFNDVLVDSLYVYYTLYKASLSWFFIFQIFNHSRKLPYTIQCIVYTIHHTFFQIIFNQKSKCCFLPAGVLLSEFCFLI